MEVNQGVGGGKIPDGAGGMVAVVTSGVGEQVVEVDDAVGEPSRFNLCDSIGPTNLSASDVLRVRYACASTAESKQMLGSLLAEVGPTLCWPASTTAQSP